jgi:hypothetical protein
MAAEAAACVVGLAAAGMGDLEAVGMGAAAVAATGNREAKQEDRNGGKHDDADKR